MATNSFDEFVKKQVRASEQSAIDWQAKRDEWLGRLTQLYGQVESYLEEFTGPGLITLARHPVVITEDYIGTYEADAMTIGIGAQQAELRPIGTLMIATAGRVDMVGPSGSTKIILAPKEVKAPIFRSTVRAAGDQDLEPEPEEIDWVWKLVVPRPSMHYVTLDRENFRSALMEIANG